MQSSNESYFKQSDNMISLPRKCFFIFCIFAKNFVTKIFDYGNPFKLGSCVKNTNSL